LVKVVNCEECGTKIAEPPKPVIEKRGGVLCKDCAGKVETGGEIPDISKRRLKTDGAVCPFCGEDTLESSFDVFDKNRSYFPIIFDEEINWLHCWNCDNEWYSIDGEDYDFNTGEDVLQELTEFSQEKCSECGKTLRVGYGTSGLFLELESGNRLFVEEPGDGEWEWKPICPECSRVEHRNRAGE